VTDRTHKFLLFRLLFTNNISTGQIGIEFSRLSQAEISPIYNTIVRMPTHVQRQAIVAILQGLSQHGSLEWTEIPEDVRVTLIIACTRELLSKKEMADVDTSKLAAIIIRSLGRLHASWTDTEIPMDFKELLRVTILEDFSCKTGAAQNNLGYVVSNVINGNFIVLRV
jgi:hypothetical protein